MTPRAVLAPLLLALLLGAPLPGAGLAAALAAAPSQHWVGAWSAGLLASTSTRTDQTLREVVRSSAAGSTARVRLSNLFGTRPIVLGGAALARRSSGAALVVGSSRRLTFGGAPAVTIAPGTEVRSDPVALDVPARSDLTVDLWIRGNSGPESTHPIALTTSYASPAGSGDHVGEQAAQAFSTTSTSWELLDGVEVLAPTSTSTVVALGDSITDGYQSTLDADHRWTDALATRLPAGLTVVGTGISGNELTRDRAGYGVSALARLDRDALDQPGVSTVVLLEGVNDLGADAVPVADLEAALRHVGARVHARGLRLLLGTLTPTGGSVQYGAGYSTPAGLQERDELNAWIRTTALSEDVADGVVDFDAALRQPQAPEVLQPAYDSGDHLHPSDAGYAAMGDVVELARLGGGAPAPVVPEAPWVALLVLAALPVAAWRRSRS